MVTSERALGITNSIYIFKPHTHRTRPVHYLASEELDSPLAEFAAAAAAAFC